MILISGIADCNVTRNNHADNKTDWLSRYAKAGFARLACFGIRREDTARVPEWEPGHHSA
jgi:hypothetical protein